MPLLISKHDLVAFDGHVSDLHQIPNPRGRTELLAGLGPALFIPVAAGVERQRLLRTRKKSLHGGVFGQQAAQDLNPVVFAELLVGARSRRCETRKQQHTGRWRHQAVSRKTHTNHASLLQADCFRAWCWMGAFQT